MKAQPWVSRDEPKGINEGKLFTKAAEDELPGKWEENQERRKEGESLKESTRSLQASEPKIIWASTCLVLFFSLHWLLGSSEIFKPLCSLTLPLVLFYLSLFPLHPIPIFSLHFFLITFNPKMEGK